MVECHNTEAYMNQTDFISIQFKPILRAPVLIRHLKRMKHCGALYVQDRMDCVGRPGMGKYSAPYGALICVNVTLFHNVCKNVRGGELVFHAAFSLLYKLTLVS